ncbi:uncharacterized protein LOC130760328 [Actinidia eriantha]|uniref:uncharacterized protein LOC130760328 n=1 Tax=Actinidia eriantha TaxID=165200 RepID=UPI002588A7CA|nr:uncharacterized protein LOC130760328 [Actinidia eriantha]XP_057471574.1 uncharacterized protein LOC130760328 [Actinidia eriantha]
MGIEKHGSKGGGGYVGSLLQLFDWNAKSRKKLFSSKSDLSEQSKQKKRSDWTTRFNPIDEDELVACTSIKGGSDYSCASSVTDEDGYGARAPGVVARLMGLDSLPTSNLGEPFSTPFFNSQSIGDVHYPRRNHGFLHKHQTMHSGNLLGKVESPTKTMESKPQKTISRPIEKFQTEILPPKSAKSIPITHHKLLSPIKSPGFIPSQNAADIMEAAAKIIDQGPQANAKHKMPSLGTSSVPLKVRDLKEKVEGSQKSIRLMEAASGSKKPAESNAAKLLKGQPMNKSWNGSIDTTSTRVSFDSEDCSGVKSNGKSISLALQAKANVQRREGLKEQGQAVSSQALKSQPNSLKSMQKKPVKHNSSGVLRQNNQKQNCLNDKDKLPARSLPSNSQGRKVVSGDSSVGRHKNLSRYGGNSKIGSRKLGTEVTDKKKQASHSSTENVPRKKRSIDGSFHPDRNMVVDTMSVDITEKLIQSNSVVERHFAWAEDRKRKGADIVSFTFTAPLTRSVQVPEKNNGFCEDDRGNKVTLNSDSPNSMKLSSVGCNVVEADALSVLLERKLRELTHGDEFPFYRAAMAGDSASFVQDRTPTSKVVPGIAMPDNKKSQDVTHMDILGDHYSPGFSSTESMGFTSKLKLQVMQETDECGIDDTKASKLLHYRHPSTISVLEPPSLSESCNSSESFDSNSTDGSKMCSSFQPQELVSMSSSNKFHLAQTDAELSDSASSTSSRTLSIRNKTHFARSTGWELEYVKEILFNVELMFKDFALGRAREIINPHLFDQLETWKEVSKSREDQKLSRKVLFECVSECTNLKCRRYASGGCRMWEKGLSTLRRKEWLAEEVYKEVSGWRGMGDCMVDDLVDKDMSSHYGKWLDFEVESFELGIEIEGRILNSLVNELVADILTI